MPSIYPDPMRAKAPVSACTVARPGCISGCPRRALVAGVCSLVRCGVLYIVRSAVVRVGVVSLWYGVVIPEGVRLARLNGEKLGSRFSGAVMDLEHACLHEHVLFRAKTLSEIGASSSHLACQSMMLWHITPAAQVR